MNGSAEVDDFYRLARRQYGLATRAQAARLWGLTEEDGPIEVTVRSSRGPRLAGVIVHRSADIARARVHVRQRIPTTNPMRALVDLAAVAPEGVVADALERGLTARLFALRGVEWALNDIARRGRNGCGVLRRVLDRRALGAEPADGLLEPRFARLAAAHGLPRYEFQHPVLGYSVDFAWVAERVAVEVDGWEVHSSPAALQARSLRS